MQVPSRKQIKECVVINQEYDTAIKKLEDAIWVLAPSSYKPIIDFHSPLSVLKIFHPDVYEEVCYYLYECDKPMPCQCQWKTINVYNKDIETLKERLLALDMIVV